MNIVTIKKPTYGVHSMDTLSIQQERIFIVAYQKEEDLYKEARHEEFRKLVYKYELKSKWISEITGRSEGTVIQWRKQKPERIIPSRALEKIKEALGLPVE